MNPTSPYWTPPFQWRPQKTLQPITNTYGFQFTLPWNMPTSAGYYFGEGAVPGRRELVYRSDPEWFATQGILPSSGNVPLVNPYTQEMNFDRAHYTVRV